ncbi:DNA binding protein [Bacillus phage vB_BceS-M2]|nr:hypothetical protein PBC5_039 [Bacillus phage PBC5]
MSFEFLSLSDMARRWGVTRQYLNKLKNGTKEVNKDEKFPEPAVKKGNMVLYSMADVLEYEKTKDFSQPHTNRLKRYTNNLEGFLDD